MIASVLQGLRDLVYPVCCPGCSQLVESAGHDFCAECAGQITGDSHQTCPRCSSSVGQFAATEDGCPRCRTDRFHFEGCRRLGAYEGRLREMILRMKQPGQHLLATQLGRLCAGPLSTRLASVRVDLVMAVPLHWWRHWRRGINQSEPLAASLALVLKLPLRTGWLRRPKATPHQVGQSGSARRQSLKSAFAVSRRARLAGQRVLLVDDVLTTGSTASAAAGALKRAGAAGVFVAVLGHG